MHATRKRSGIAGRIRTHVAAVASVIWALAAVTMSPLGAEVALADGPSAANRPAAVYGGTTSNGWPVFAEVTSDGHRIKRVLGAIYLDCGQGQGFTMRSQWHNLRISRSGTFKTSYRDTSADEGVETTYSETFAGRINRARTRLSASWRISMTFGNPDGAVDTCDSGALSVALHR